MIQSNSTFVIVNLSSWRAIGCPIQYFVVQYKPRTQRDFILLSNHVLPEAGNLIITDLAPARWYTLFLTGVSEAGSTEAEYAFSTLTPAGELIPAFPLESLYDLASRVRIVMPVASATLVACLLIGLMIVLRRKRRSLLSAMQHRHPSFVAYPGKSQRVRTK